MHATHGAMGPGGQRAITAIIHKYVPRASSPFSPLALFSHLWQRHHNNRNNNRVVKMSQTQVKEAQNFKNSTSKPCPSIALRFDLIGRRRLSDPTGKAVGCSAFSGARAAPHLPATFGPPAVIFIDIPQIWRRGGSLRSPLGDPSLPPPPLSHGENYSLHNNACCNAEAQLVGSHAEQRHTLQRPNATNERLLAQFTALFILWSAHLSV